MTIYCTYCGQGFARNEHLQRHVLTHTDLRPFECPVCHLTFKRRDLLKRHFIAHDVAESQSGLSAQDAESARTLLAKVRNTAACLNCAQNKTKCDNDVDQPCTRCRSKGLTCTARTTRPRGPRPRHARRPSLNKTLDEATADSAANNACGNVDVSKSPITSGCAEKEAQSNNTRARDAEPGPSINVAAASTTTPPSPSASPWNTSSSFSRLPSFDKKPEPFNHEAQNQDAYPTTSDGPNPEGSQLQTSAGTVEMPGTTQPSFVIHQSSTPMGQQPPEFLQDAFDPMGPTHDQSLLFGPSWDLGSSPDQFFNPSSEVFGPFLGFTNSASFDGMGLPTMANPGDDLIMQDGSQTLLRSEESHSVLPSQQQKTVNHNEDEYSKKTATQVSRVDVTSPLVLDIDTGASSSDHSQHSADPWLLPKGVEHWTMLQCCPTPSTVAPGQAKENLAFLEANFRHGPDPWSLCSSCDDNPREERSPGRCSHVNISLSPVTRERISAITQSFFAKALEMHGLGVTSSPSSHRRASEWFGSSGFILLPPTQDLEVFLENYMNYVEPYCPLVPTRTLDPNELLVASGNEKGATLLLLLMIAIGAGCDPTPKARRLGAGLAEMCRISLTDLVEKDNKYSTVPLVLQCSLLLTIQSCWGGQKWQMDIGAGHRSRYIAMLRNSGYFKSMTSRRPKAGIDKFGLYTAWRTWVEQEGRRRLAYNWVMLDQELSLFYDQPPTFAITELGAPLPEADEFWLAKSAAEWRSLYDREHGQQHDLPTHLSLRPQYSLRQLFRLCLADEINSNTYKLTPTRLRLLLYPLQGLVFHHSQLLDAFPDISLLSISSLKTTTRTSSILRLDELQSLLQSWWTLAQIATTNNDNAPDHEQSVVCANFILFHLVSLNLYTGLKAIESFARGERGWEGGDEDEDVSERDRECDARHRYLTGRCVYAPHDALYHAGQVLRLVYNMPVRSRPPWWAAAVYRVALILWAYSMAQVPTSLLASAGSIRDHNSSGNHGASAPASAPASNFFSTLGGESTVPINAIMPTDPAVSKFLKQKRGIPVLIGSSSDSTILRLDNPRLVLQWCIDALKAEHRSSTWFAIGIRIKLETLLQAWKG